MIIKAMQVFLLGDPEKAVKNSYIWNSISGLLNAGQSALLLIVLSHTNPQEDAGVFSMAYAISALAFALGSYSMRTYQVTDVEHKYSFGQYISSRVITTALMLLLMIYYVVKGILFLDYPAEKCIVIVFMTLLKLIDVVDDVFIGMFQQKGRLDIVTRCSTIRYVLFLIIFSAALLVSHDLVIASGIAFVCSMLVFSFQLSLVYGAYREPIHIQLTDKKIYRLLTECFSLFVGGFLMIYVANAPKYAIDAQMDEIAQAVFNYLFMPVYVVSVLNAFIYQPILTRLAELFEERKMQEFKKLFHKQIYAIGGLVALVLAGGYLLGIPVLSKFYNMDLTPYKWVLMILLLGSGFLALAGYLGVVITIMRKQKWLIIGYAAAALLALLLSGYTVGTYGLMGAAVMYTGIVFGQMVVFEVLYRIEISR